MGNQCCMPKQNLGFTQNQKQPMTLQNVQLKCQICSEELEHINLKNHLDVLHYATVSEKQNGSLIINCLLCGYQAVTLQGHHMHLRMKHKYLLSGGKTSHKNTTNISNIQLNSSIKKRVVEATQYDCKIIKPNLVQINGEAFEAVHFEKQYGAVQFDQEKAKGDLVWRYIFTKYQNAAYYCITHEPAQRSIISKSRIFTRHQAQ